MFTSPNMCSHFSLRSFHIANNFSVSRKMQIHHQITNTRLVGIQLLICASVLNALANYPGSVSTAVEYRAMCRIYRTALKHHNDSASAYVGSKLDWKRFDELYERAKACVEATGNTTEGEVELATDFDSVKLPSGPVTIKVREVCAAFASRMRGIVKEAEGLKSVAESAARRAFNNLSGVITAESNLTHIAHKPLGLNGNTNRQTLCNSHTRGGRAGVQLTVDLMCLCGPDGGSTDKACGFYIDSYWSDPSPGGVEGIWSKIHNDCIKLPLDDDVSPSNIDASVEHFDQLLGAQSGTDQSVTANSSWIIGNTVQYSGCTKGNKQSAMCIDYANADGSLGEIKWITQIFKARNLLLEAEANVAKARKLLERMEFLLIVLEKELAGISNFNEANFKTFLKRKGGRGSPEDELYDSSVFHPSVITLPPLAALLTM
ncbi:Variant surface glycoprotein [Trypanosoma congolense IL3000]|uniref:Variant surface glycoprotein n=1 Tax=Trypanosoma congolense (strain IL3000) TaxID=1068625 RepID=F9W704_TRYCI|nr:Variant surface glycoprotein [Trypanosoma congolense IL3000]